MFSVISQQRCTTMMGISFAESVIQGKVNCTLKEESYILAFQSLNDNKSSPEAPSAACSMLWGSLACTNLLLCVVVSVIPQLQKQGLTETAHVVFVFYTLKSFSFGAILASSPVPCLFLLLPLVSVGFHRWLQSFSLFIEGFIIFLNGGKT